MDAFSRDTPECLVPRLIALLLLLTPLAGAVELHIQFAALERMLSEQLFTQDGRRYVHGSAANKCNFAYLEKPHFQGAGGKLRIRAKFTGRSALNMFGQCVGLGDAFTAVITAVPQYKDGNIGLANVAAVSEDHTGYYVRRVCAALSSSLAHEFRYPIGAAAKSALEDPGAQPGYPRELRGFTVTEIRVTNDELILAVDFQLTIK
jgi:hypothetical protein